MSNDNSGTKLSATKRLPWQDEPYIDHKAAQKRAIRAAQPRPVDPNSPAVKGLCPKGIR